MKQTNLHFCLTALALAAMISAQAQVTITYDDFPRQAMFTDSISRAEPPSLLLPSEGPDQVWDYSNLVLDASIEVDYFDAAGNANFPGALNYRQSDLIFQIFPIQSFRYEAVDAEGYYEVGRTIGEVSYSITPISGGLNDSLRFPENNIVFEGRLNSVKFPLNYGDDWTESRVERTPFELTVQAFGLNKTPGERKRTVSHHRRVAGHGKLILPYADGTPTGEMDVLMIRVVRHSIDSVFLGGAPAPAPLMAAFGLTQGGMAADSFYVFYKPGFGAPIMDIDYDDSRIFYRPQAAETASSTSGLSLLPTKHFPNPVEAGGMLTIEMEQPFFVGTISLTDLYGRSVTAVPTTGGEGSRAQLRVPAGTGQGLYYYHLLNMENQQIGMGKVFVR